MIEGQASEFVFAQLPTEVLSDYHELTSELTRRYRVSRQAGLSQPSLVGAIRNMGKKRKTMLPNSSVCTIKRINNGIEAHEMRT
ncbi:hypothetical protein DPMN_073851 [Dreissena polymorpha]|uniref:Uncharacterized protein n=1 Tax=Dreissena polymorpha TaxID=45954 RepID=A0A9D3YI14_DREPO|nr:hypothetical protein DPMN_073851 [Dreissena polymorpha]